MFHLWCAGKLGNCPKVALERPRFTCVYCRWRRRFYGKFTEPPYWIEYTYKSIFNVKLVRRYVRGNLEFTVRDGRLLEVKRFGTLKIDPRGHFTRLRCATIIVLDAVIGFTGFRKPFTELAEFLANYPIW